MYSHLSPVVQKCVGYNCGIGGKEPEVHGNVTGRHVGRRVCLVHFLIEDTSFIGNVEDVVCLPESIKGSVAVRVSPMPALQFDKVTDELMGRYPVNQELE